MKQLSCRELGGNCDYVATGATADDVKQNMWQHAQSDHAEMFQGMTPEQEASMQAKMDSTIRDA